MGFHLPAARIQRELDEERTRGEPSRHGFRIFCLENEAFDGRKRQYDVAEAGRIAGISDWQPAFIQTVCQPVEVKGRDVCLLTLEIIESFS